MESEALQQLQSEQSELLNVIDQLGDLGIGRLVQLPQLIVCGDQSSGKSSVLEAISRVRFPSKDQVCTRFATEYIFRKGIAPKVKIRIEPNDEETSEEEKTRLRSFPTSDLDTTTNLGDIIEKATEWMKLSPEDDKAGFSYNILKVEISGPDKPELTLVDLPGLYRASSAEQSAKGIPVVQSLLTTYMKNPRSIILAVVSAKTSYNLQDILEITKPVDPNRERTFGIITKPDTLERGTAAEEYWIEFAENKRINLRLGWHVLRNRLDQERDSSDEERDKTERAFFSTGRWARVSKTLVGISSLRPRLSRILLDHIRENLPKLVDEIDQSLQDRQAKLEKLGDERSTLSQQRGYLVDKSSQFDRITTQAINGMYVDSFFGGLHQGDATANPNRLRAVIRDLNEKFAINMRLNGQRRQILNTERDRVDSGKSTTGKNYIMRAELEEEISDNARTYRGIELPGSANQLLVGELFRDQSKPWENIAREHISTVWKTVREFVVSLLQHLTDDATYLSLLRTVIDPSLESMREALNRKLDELLSYHKRGGHPLPLDETFLAKIQKFRIDRQFDLLSQTLSDMDSPDHSISTMEFNLKEIKNFAYLAWNSKPHGNQFAAGEIIDLMESYYNIAITTFIDNVAILAIENCLIYPLETIFTPRVVTNLGEYDIIQIASEPLYIQESRQQLKLDLDILKLGQQACQRYSLQSKKRDIAKDSSPDPSETKSSKNPLFSVDGVPKPDWLNFKLSTSLFSKSAGAPSKTNLFSSDAHSTFNERTSIFDRPSTSTLDDISESLKNTYLNPFAHLAESSTKQNKPIFSGPFRFDYPPTKGVSDSEKRTTVSDADSPSGSSQRMGGKGNKKGTRWNLSSA